MRDPALFFALLLLANLAVGLVRVVRGPHLMDRIAALQLFGTVGVAILLLLGASSNDGSLRIAALLLSLLSGTVTICLLAALGDRERIGNGAGR